MNQFHAKNLKHVIKEAGLAFEERPGQLEVIVPQDSNALKTLALLFKTALNMSPVNREIALWAVQAGCESSHVWMNSLLFDFEEEVKTKKRLKFELLFSDHDMGLPQFGFMVRPTLSGDAETV